MTTKSRLRNTALPIALAALAAILVGIYIVSYRNSVTHAAGLVTVYVAGKDIPAGTDGGAIAAGGYLKTQTVPRRAVVPGAITGSAALTSLVAAAPIYKGEQITLRQFGPVSQGGVFAKFSGVGRIVAVPGDQNQLLAGTMSEGDRVDVVATAKYHFGQLSRSTTRVVLRNLLVVKAPNAPSGQPVASGTPSLTAQLVMTDKQAQIMGWVMKNATWFLALRPTKQPRDGAVRLETLQSVLGQGLPKDSIAAQIAGAYPESVDDGN